VYDRTANPDLAGFTRVLVTEPSHPYVGAWWPAGHVLGYEHAFTHQAVDLVRAIAAGEDPAPSFRDGLQVQRVLEALKTSARESTWKDIEA
jgi:predicted dehydrogenase